MNFKCIILIISTCFLVAACSKEEEQSSQTESSLRKDIVVINNAGTQKLTVAWHAEFDETNYRVYRSTKKETEFQLIAETTEHYYVDSNVETGRRYYYRVSSYDLPTSTSPTPPAPANPAPVATLPTAIPTPSSSPPSAPSSPATNTPLAGPSSTGVKPTTPAPSAPLAAPPADPAKAETAAETVNAAIKEATSVVSSGEDQTLFTGDATNVTCFAQADLRSIKSTSDLSAQETKIKSLYTSCRPYLQKTFPGKTFSEAFYKMAFATIAAHNLFVYGGSISYNFEDLLSDSTLDCDNYAFLAGHIFEILAGKDYTEKLFFIGFDHGYVGNHAQIHFISESQSYLVDPTIGIIARVNKESLLEGTPLKLSEVFSFYAYWDDTEQALGLNEYYWTVRTALLEGFYKADDVIYYYERLKGLSL